MIKFKNATITVVIIFALFVIATSATVIHNFAIFANSEYFYLATVLAIVIGLRQADLSRIRKLNKNFVTQYSQMDSMINNSPFIIFLKDSNGKILLANKQLAKVLNTKTDKIIGKSIYKIYANAQTDIEEDKKILATGNSTSSERQVEINNNKYWFKITKIPIKDTLGKVVKIVVILVNTDIEKEIEGSKSSYIATLTHDLKTPTNAQLQAADLLLSGILGDLSEEQKEIITQMKCSCNYMNELIFTILDSYLYENGQTKINSEKFDIVELVNTIVAGLSNLLSVKNQQIRIYPEKKEIFIVADKFQIKRVIVNFLGNAINYGFKNSIINISIKEKFSTINFNVRNKSEYIPEEKIKEIFKKYKHNPDAKYQKTATGLGLYLSKQIIDAHKGSVYAKSDKDQTCDFGFELPKKSTPMAYPEKLPEHKTISPNKILKFIH